MRFVSADGRRRPARGFIEFDHVKPFAKRGAADPQNIRLLCRSHNLRHARRCCGSLHISAKNCSPKALPIGRLEREMTLDSDEVMAQDLVSVSAARSPFFRSA